MLQPAIDIKTTFSPLSRLAGLPTIEISLEPLLWLG